MQARRAFLEGILDYAGMFPPESLPLDEAVRRYAGLRRHPHAWMLGRFVVPAGRLAEVEPDGAWPLSVLCGRGGEWLSGLRGEVRQVQEFLERHPSCSLGAVELTAAPELEEGLALLPAGVPVFCETGWAGDLEATAARLAAAGAGWKLRTGGATPRDHPPPARLAEVLALAARHRVPVKFTAGLHAPVRHEAPAVGCRQFGFVGAFAAGMLDLTAQEREAVLEEGSLEAFHLDGELRWRGHALDAQGVAEGRRRVVSFGSCSFTEPVEALEEAGWI